MVNDNESEDDVSHFAMVDGVSRYPPDLDREDAACRFAKMPRSCCFSFREAGRQSQSVDGVRGGKVKGRMTITRGGTVKGLEGE
ncbi:hypothetical protein BVRB_9g208580 [Beta vulgaris subsp. vulgaris]|nr:hypothetical protein BVRB_9g208580 [Beta vulgaris subsp. vulgaris]